MEATDDIHSRYGGSGARRWLNCAGSVALIDTVPKLPTSRWAAEGLVAHDLGARCLKNGLHNVFAGMEEGVVYPDDMAVAVQIYLDAVYKELARTPDAELYVEHKFAFPNLGDGKEVFGRNDAIVYHPSTGRVVAFEYKHGAGVYVPVENNEQVKFYLCGAVLSNPSWRVSEAILVVVQPRFWDAEHTEPVQSWPLDVVELIDFISELDLGIKAAKSWGPFVASAKHPLPYRVEDADKDGAFKTGDWCRWCDAAAVCPAREREVMETMKLTYLDMAEITPDQLPTVEALMRDTTAKGAERLANIIHGLDVLETWAAQVRDFAEAHMIAGTLQVPGWKVVDKIGKRKWISADSEVVAYLELLYGVTEDEIRPRKLVTLGDAEKLLKAAGTTKDEREAVFDRFTRKESSGQTIAPVSDKREAVDAAARDFAGVNITI